LISAFGGALGLAVPNSLSIVYFLIIIKQSVFQLMQYHQLEEYSKIKLLREGAFGKAYLVQAVTSKDLCFI
jgi:hypothetical protein